MGTYTIRVKIDIVECPASEGTLSALQEEGRAEQTLNEQDALNIDRCESAVLQTTHTAMRAAISQHLANLSKHHAVAHGETGTVIANPYPYRVDGEVGRFEFPTYSVFRDGTRLYDSRELFPRLKGKAWYRTCGFKEIALVYGCVEESFRKTSALLNRIRYQPGATPSRTLRDNAYDEGRRLGQAIEAKSQEILLAHDFRQDGTFQGEATRYHQTTATISQERVNAAIATCQGRLEACGLPVTGHIRENPVGYEDPEQTVNISDDDVSVKRQTATRQHDAPPSRPSPPKKRKYLHDTIVHVEKGGSSYLLTGAGIAQVLRVLIAFLLKNQFVTCRFQFFTDGYTRLNETILSSFAWYPNLGIILDWHHLDTKCQQKLSSALTGRDIRNAILGKLLVFLWYGCVDDAIAYLTTIKDEEIKNRSALEALFAYFERNAPYIPCYAVRKELGLRNSSNIGEKMNDLVVSDRQKHHGMSWSKEGSVALAALTALIRNNEHALWFEEGDLEFKLAA